MTVETKRNAFLTMCIWFLLILFAGFICIGLGACRSIKYVPVETVKHDSIYITQHQKDSIYVHDSIYKKEKGDTLIIEKWHTKYIEKQVRDTLIQIERDTIPQPYPYEVEVPAQLSWWQKTRLYLANVVLLALAVFIGWKIYRRKW